MAYHARRKKPLIFFTLRFAITVIGLACEKIDLGLTYNQLAMFIVLPSFFFMIPAAFGGGFTEYVIALLGVVVNAIVLALILYAPLRLVDELRKRWNASRSQPNGGAEQKTG